MELPSGNIYDFHLFMSIFSTIPRIKKINISIKSNKNEGIFLENGMLKTLFYINDDAAFENTL